MKKIAIEESVKSFSVDFNPIDINDVLDVHEHLMKKTK